MRLPTLPVLTALLAACSPVVAASAAQIGPPEQDAPRIVLTSPEVTRPPALPAMYISLASLQAYDGYSTLRGVRAGATETNPLVGGLASRPAAFWTVKALSTVTTICFAEKLWREHKRGEAILTMVVANAVMGVVAVRNASVLHGR